MKNENIRIERVLNLRGIGMYDIFSRILSVVVSLLSISFGIINTIIVDFVISYED
jgi:hypothetical protein